MRCNGFQKKERNKTCPSTASQSEGHDESEASGSEVQINFTPEDHSPRATRSLTKRAILQDTPPQSEEPTGNDNTLSPSLASLVACLMAGYLVNMGMIIATEMKDRALNERVRFPFPCLIGKLCRQVDTPPNKLIDKWRNIFRLIQVSKIKDVANDLFGAKSAAMGTLVVVPHVPLEIPQADRGTEQEESSQPSKDAPPPPALAPQAPASVGASGNGAPAPTSEDQPDQVSSSESAPIDKGANVDPKIGA
uniref:Putative plant transposon protein domain-containing protein n=1 Tax=Solanum tuberosum TaxID=4113 RepID=M1DGE7_SOLTU